MRFKFPAFLFIAFMLLSAFADGQTGYLDVKVYGTKHPFCKLDNIPFQSNDTTITSIVGNHRIRVWMPTAALIDTTIFVKEKDTTRFSCMLYYSKAYTDYLQAYSDYRMLRNRRYFVSPIWAGLTVGTGVFIGQYFAKKEYDKALDARDEYERRGSQSLMNDQKAIFDDHKKKYDNLKKLEYGVYGIAGLVMVNYVRIMIKQSKIHVPQFNETNPLAKLNRVDLYPSFIDKTVTCSLALHF